MTSRGLLTAGAAVLLLAGMYVSVHRGATGRAVAERLGRISDQQEATAVTRAELERDIEHLRSRARVIRAAERLGMHVPTEDELVILDLRGEVLSLGGGSP